jgi:glycine/D-amino acid oxidase-like deaminating enzyme
MLWEFYHSHLDIPWWDRSSNPDSSRRQAYPLSVDPSLLLDHDFYPEICLRGLETMVPGFSQYTRGDNDVPRSTSVDGGYYTRTPENVPLVDPVCHTGPLLKFKPHRDHADASTPPPVESGEFAPGGHSFSGQGDSDDDMVSVQGMYLCGGLSGFGMMGGHAAGELAAMHVTGSSSLDAGGSASQYAAALSPARYGDASYVNGLADQIESGKKGQI